MKELVFVTHAFYVFACALTFVTILIFSPESISEVPMSFGLAYVILWAVIGFVPLVANMYDRIFGG